MRVKKENEEIIKTGMVAHDMELRISKIDK